jgi:hypothetical protein
MDRLQMKMSEELHILNDFFPLMRAKPENFVSCLIFCDSLKDETIKSFEDELKSPTDMEMFKEVRTMIFTAFSNHDDCDTDKRLVEYLKDKTHKSRLRILRM